MCPIDDIMDFNGDGKVTDFEKILLAGALAETMEAEEKGGEWSSHSLYLRIRDR